MTIIMKSLIAALGFLAAGSVTAASAASPHAAPSTAVVDEASRLHLVTERGSWAKPKHYSRHDHYDRGRGYDRYEDDHYRKHYKKKKRRKVFKRGYKRGYSRGFDEGYYEGRRDSRYRRHRDHHYHYDRGFRGGVYFGDGYFGGGGFRFRY
jgi:hypothetical protein